MGIVRKRDIWYWNKYSFMIITELRHLMFWKITLLPLLSSVPSQRRTHTKCWLLTYGSSIVLWFFSVVYSVLNGSRVRINSQRWLSLSENFDSHSNRKYMILCEISRDEWWVTKAHGSNLQILVGFLRQCARDIVYDQNKSENE